MEYQIVQKEAFRIVGFRTSVPKDQEESFQVVPGFWGGVGNRLGELIPLMGPAVTGVLSVYTCHLSDNFYFNAVASDKPIPKGMWEWTVPAATWTVFSGTGQQPSPIQELQKRVATEWLPDSGYEWAKAPDIELYLNRPDEEESRFQVWLPVVKR